MALRFASNSIAKFSSIVSVDWENVSNKPGGLPITVGSSAVLNGTTGGILYNNNGVLGELDPTVTGYRELLIADRVYYVAPTGSDVSNNGLDISHPFLTIQHPLALIQNTLDLQGHLVTILVSDGTYTTPIIIDGPHVGGGSVAGGGSVTLSGNIGTPSNCLIRVANTNAITMSNGATLTLTGFKLVTTGSGGDCLNIDSGARCLVSAVDFGDSIAAQITLNNGAVLNAFGSYAISGNPGGAHIHQPSPSIWTMAPGASINLIGVRSWGDYFIGMRGPSYAYFKDMTFTGSGAIGLRGVVHNGAVLDAENKDPDFFPGSISISVEQGGTFIANKRSLAPGASQTFNVLLPGMLQVADNIGNHALIAFNNNTGVNLAYIVWQPGSSFQLSDFGAGSNTWWVQPNGVFTNRFVGVNALKVQYMSMTILQ